MKREVFEELGIKEVKILKVVRVWHIFRGTKKAENELIGITFHCRTQHYKIKISKEHSQYKWVTPKEALKLITNDGIKGDIMKFIESGRK